MTAENLGDDGRLPVGECASMRPRPMTAENHSASGPDGEGASASMRPRPMTAENRIVTEDELSALAELQ